MARQIPRRRWLQAAGMFGTSSYLTAAATADESSEPAAQKGRIKQSLVHWCYAGEHGWKDFDELCQVAVRLGCKSVELCGPEHWPTLKKHGLTCAIAGSHGFKVGFNNPDEWAQCTDSIRKRIDDCLGFGVKRIITFTGMANGIGKEEGAANFIKGIKESLGHAEKAGIDLCLEMLNTRDDSHPMKGHPGYQGNDIEYCIDICKKIGSPNLKVLFDVYHVQIMHGDVICRIRQHKDYIGHIHTAGNPGRAELDQTQEILYPPIMQTLLDIGYTGYVGQEFIPTRDAWAGLKEAVALCDV
jgi:hydroxypyruvate isomerase